MKNIAILLTLLIVVKAYPQRITDATSRLHAVLPIDYETPRGKPIADNVKQVLERVHAFLNEGTPTILIDKDSGKEITDLKMANEHSMIKPVDFRLISYEWGVTYAGMLSATKATGDKRYEQYTYNRLKFLAELNDVYIDFEKEHPNTKHPMHRVIHPRTLDDAGAMCAAMIKAEQAGFTTDLEPLINTFMNHISNNQYRLPDGTLARNGPYPNTLWLDDLFMSVPALARMGNYTSDTKYYDDAVKQILQFSERMFNEEKGLYMHGWVQGMEQHPQFHWARANGWAVMAMVELLEVLPENYPGREKVIALLKAHIYGLAKYQSKNGMWHQLIDRNDSYLETSASAIYTYSIARAINRGWIDKKVYTPMVYLAWNGVAGQVNEKGQVENTCVGTGMDFDPAFYFYRPVHVYAAHGYGPVLLAGAEIIELLKNQE